MWILSLKISLVIFIAGNLLELGLNLNPADILKGLKNFRFVTYTLFWGFIAGPLLAFTITTFIPMEEPYATGLILLGLAPSAPFLPMLIKRINGDRGYTAAFMFIMATGIVLVMPLAIPVLAQGLSVSAWTIAQPLLLFILMPMVMGMLLLRWNKKLSAQLCRSLKNINSTLAITTILFAMLVFGKDIIAVADGTIILAQVLFFTVMMICPYWFSFGSVQHHRLIMSMGMSTRNLGAAVAPMLSLPDMDQRTFIMIVLAVPIMIGTALLAAKLYGNDEPAEAQSSVS
jgi:bile acid:Na+ symporter, BASS family